ncbi:hypothetical protein GCM10025876_21860 [Demequina litorisediminis]|uniref:Uncharacterized protein n=1 Tax=Demequina litorisediminis TaxID=1849022 RepID=A0ABQ6IDP1_9MICO|nr:hypothetical protein [Demequina litorisediminis]GMA35982.1 hypothetical protein GCM10025876_21860 [Demequina litorisediminis]
MTPVRGDCVSVTRRRRRERQIIVFGVIAIILAAIAVASAAVFRGDADGPFSAAFTTPAGEFESDVTLVCPPADAMPLEYDQVVVRVNNGTDTSGLASTAANQARIARLLGDRVHQLGARLRRLRADPVRRRRRAAGVHARHPVRRDLRAEG